MEEIAITRTRKSLSGSGIELKRMVSFLMPIKLRPKMIIMSVYLELLKKACG